jgi:uncharacterized membrane protein
MRTSHIHSFKNIITIDGLRNNIHGGKNMTQKRWKSKVLWMAIIAQVIALLSAFGFWQAIGVTEDWVNKIVVIAMQLLTILGVVNNPTDPNSI